MGLKTFVQVLVGTSLVCGAFQASSAERIPPLRVIPVEMMGLPDASQLSSPSVDKPSAINVTIASVYKPINPCRIADTRYIDVGNGLGAGFGGEQTVGFWGWAGTDGYSPFGGNNGTCGIPSTAVAIHINFSIVSTPSAQGFLRAWPNDPEGAPEAPAATLMAWGPGLGASNAVTVPICSDTTALGGGGADSCSNPDPLDPISTTDFFVKIWGIQANLIIDAVGYYEPLSLN